MYKQTVMLLLFLHLVCLLPSIYGKCASPHISYDDSCYYFHNVTSTFGGHTYNDSRVICQNLGGDLASISDKNESDFITRMFSDKWVKRWQKYWIGKYNY